MLQSQTTSTPEDGKFAKLTSLADLDQRNAALGRWRACGREIKSPFGSYICLTNFRGEGDCPVCVPTFRR